MKRSLLQRRTPLRRVAMSPRRTGLKRVPFVSGPPKSKPGKKNAQRKVRVRSGGMCEIGIQGICWGRGTEFSHRVRDGQGGPWAASNGLRACRPCHDWIGDNFYGARAKGWALKSNEDYRREPAVRFGRWELLRDDGSVVPSKPGRAKAA